MTSLLLGFLVVLAVVGGTEFIDRTNFALIALAARVHRPAPLWGGATLAFGITTLIAVGIGAILGSLLVQQHVYLQLGGGAFILAYAAYLYLKKEGPETEPTSRTAFTTAFLLILLLELGDTTMILELNFALILPAYVVGIASILGLAAVAASACLIGPRIARRVHPQKIERFVIVVLVIVGVLVILSALDPSVLPSVFR